MASPKTHNSLRGRFLVAGPKLRDRNFFKSVVLMLEHSSDGAMGLIVNRPSSLSVANALAGHLSLRDDEEPVFAGGPVEPADLFMLHEDNSLDQQSVSVAEGLFVTTSAVAFESLLNGDGPPRARRVVSGYAGWSGGQLESEVRSGDWLAVPATAESVFDADPYELWDELHDGVARQHRIVADPGLHPEWN